MVRQTVVSEGVQSRGHGAGVSRRREDVGRGSETKAEAWLKSRRRSRLESRTMAH